MHLYRSKNFLMAPWNFLLCERVNDRYSLFHLLNCLIKFYLELREEVKVTGNMLWTIGRLWNCLDAIPGQIVCDKDRDVDWSIVSVEMPLTLFEECCLLPTESLPELP